MDKESSCEEIAKEAIFYFDQQSIPIVGNSNNQREYQYPTGFSTGHSTNTTLSSQELGASNYFGTQMINGFQEFDGFNTDFLADDNERTLGPSSQGTRSSFGRDGSGIYIPKNSFENDMEQTDLTLLQPAQTQYFLDGMNWTGEMLVNGMNEEGTGHFVSNQATIGNFNVTGTDIIMAHNFHGESPDSEYTVGQKNMAESHRHKHCKVEKARREAIVQLLDGLGKYPPLREYLLQKFKDGKRTPLNKDKFTHAAVLEGAKGLLELLVEENRELREFKMRMEARTRIISYFPSPKPN